MMEKTKLIFKNYVMEGYVHYINFKRDFSGALEAWRKYALPVECNMGIDANNDWLILTFSYDEEEEDYLEILENEWDTVTTFLKEEGIQFVYPYWNDDWSIVILIDDFVEYVLKKYVLDGDVDLLNEQDIEIKRLKEELFEARKDYIVDAADISDKPYLDEMIEEERKEIYERDLW